MLLSKPALRVCPGNGVTDKVTHAHMDTARFTNLYVHSGRCATDRRVVRLRGRRAVRGHNRSHDTGLESWFAPDHAGTTVQTAALRSTGADTSPSSLLFDCAISQSINHASSFIGGSGRVRR